MIMGFGKLFFLWSFIKYIFSWNLKETIATFCFRIYVVLLREKNSIYCCSFGRRHEWFLSCIRIYLMLRSFCLSLFHCTWSHCYGSATARKQVIYIICHVKYSLTLFTWRVFVSYNIYMYLPHALVPFTYFAILSGPFGL